MPVTRIPANAIKARSRLAERHFQTCLDAFHGNKCPEALYVIVAEEQSFRQRLVGRHVRHDDHKQEVDLPSHIIALLDLGRGGKFALGILDLVRGLADDLDFHENRDGMAQGGWIDDRDVGLDHAGFGHLLDPSLDGRCRQVDCITNRSLRRQIVLLKDRQNLSVEIVKRDPSRASVHLTLPQRNKLANQSRIISANFASIAISFQQLSEVPMFLTNTNSLHRSPLDARDAETLGLSAAAEVERFLTFRKNNAATPLVALPNLADKNGVASIHVKDESHRLGLGSFKALGGSYAVIRLVLDQAMEKLGRQVDVAELATPEVAGVAATMTFACATDGNHGRSVAQGAQLVGARAVVFVHAGVSDERVAAIARFGAEMVRVDGTYDESVKEAARVAEEHGWTIVSDTSWPGYERIPGLVMQGYTAIVREALRALPEPPTHVFVQAGVGGIAAAIAGHLALVLGDDRPIFIVVDPERAACIFESAKAGHPVSVPHGEPTVMAMLECYEPSLVAWRILSRAADAFMTLEEEDAIAVMRLLARPFSGDPAIVAGESGGVGLAGLMKAASDPDIRTALGLGPQSRVLTINTEGATDPEKYAEIVGMTAAEVIGANLENAK